MLVRAIPSHRWVVALLAIGAVGAACSLNPQPLPPDTEYTDAGNPSGITGGEDASSASDTATTQSPDGAGGVDSGGSTPDASLAGDGEAMGDAHGNEAGDADVDAPVDGAVDGGEGDALDEGD